MDLCPPTMTLAVGLRPCVVWQPLVTKADAAMATARAPVRTVLETVVLGWGFLLMLWVDRVDDMSVPDSKNRVIKA